MDEPRVKEDDGTKPIGTDKYMYCMHVMYMCMHVHVYIYMCMCIPCTEQDKVSHCFHTELWEDCKLKGDLFW